jgi:hypothetical protein
MFWIRDEKVMNFESVVGLFHNMLAQSQENFQDLYAH